MSRIETASRIVLTLIKAFNQHDIESMISLLSTDCKYETNNPAPDGNRIIGKEGIRKYWNNILNENPDIQVKIEEVMGFGLRCLLCWRYEWTESKGQILHLRGMDVYKIKEDKINEMLSYVKG